MLITMCPYCGRGSPAENGQTCTSYDADPCAKCLAWFKSEPKQ